MLLIQTGDDRNPFFRVAIRDYQLLFRVRFLKVFRFIIIVFLASV